MFEKKFEKLDDSCSKALYFVSSLVALGNQVYWQNLPSFFFLAQTPPRPMLSSFFSCKLETVSWFWKTLIRWIHGTWICKSVSFRSSVSQDFFIPTLHGSMPSLIQIWNEVHCFKHSSENRVRGGGHSTFFQVGVCGPDFRSVGLANWHLPLTGGACERKISKFGGLWAENFQIWGLVSWKFSNLGACELKFGWKLRLLRLKFPNFLKRGSCELTLLLEMGPLRAAGETWKGGLQGRTSPYPLSRSVPPPPRNRVHWTKKMK